MGSSRWLRVLALLANEGLTQRQAAERLHVSLRTVKSDLVHARRVLDARTTNQAVATAVRAEWI